jgi:hypothetical protein
MRTTRPDPRPKALALTVLVNWSNLEKANLTLEAEVKLALRPRWLSVHFGPPPSSLAAGPVTSYDSKLTVKAGQWQLALNVYAAEKTPLVKKKNETSVPSGGRLLLMFNGEPFGPNRYAVVRQHCRFPPGLVPRVVAVHRNGAEPDPNALVFVRTQPSIKRYREDSYIKVVRGHIYHFHITFPDGSLVNRYIAQGWGFTASLFTNKRKRDGFTNVSPSCAVTQIQAKWLDLVEPDPDKHEITLAKQIKAIEDPEDIVVAAQRKAYRDEKARKRAENQGKQGGVSKVSERSRHPSGPACPLSGIVEDHTQPVAGPPTIDGPVSFFSTAAEAAAVAHAYFQQQQLLSQQQCEQQKQAAIAAFQAQPAAATARAKKESEWMIADLNALPYMQSVSLPDTNALKHYDSAGIDFGHEVAACVGMSNTPATITGVPNTAKPTPVFSPNDTELLTFFSAVEERAKRVVTDSNSNVHWAAVRLTQVLSASTQLGGWRHVEEFLTDQDEYMKNQGPRRPVVTRSVPSAAAGPATALAAAAPAAGPATVEPKGKIEKLLDSSADFLRATFMRVKWVLEIEKKAGAKQADGKTTDRALAVLLKDQKWMLDATDFLQSAVQEVSSLLNKNPAAFAKFREISSRGVPWPHSPHLRRRIELCGYVYRPMMIKRDRCVCEACGVEVSGWRPWHNPWLFHDWSRRHPFAPPPGTLQSALQLSAL